MSELIPLTADWSLARALVFRSAGADATVALQLSGPAPGQFLPDDALAAAEQRLIADPWLREAVLWQNPKVIDDWAAAGRARPTRARYRQMALARYLQRYATKNETIGFFGPVAWGQLDPTATELIAELGAGEELERHSYFEPWSIQSLAGLWQRDPELRAALCPRLPAAYRLDGQRVQLPSELSVELSSRQAEIVRHCDGVTQPSAIAAATGCPLAEVLTELAELADRGVLNWDLDLPYDEHLDQHLADRLAGHAELPAARRYLGCLEQLRAARAEVDRSAGDPDRLRHALAELHSRYRSIAGRPAAISKDDNDTSRGLLWLDALSDWDVVLGAPALADLSRPLGLLLDTARWLSWQLAATIDAAALELIAETGTGELAFDVLFDELRPELTALHTPSVTQLIEQLRAKVAELIPLPTDDQPGPAGSLRLSSAELAGAWQAAFAAPGPGWSGARTHSADIMLASPSRSAANAGDYTWVLGELHVATNPLDFRFCTGRQRDFIDLSALADEISAGVQYQPAFPRQWNRLTPRTYPAAGLARPAERIHWCSWPDDIAPPDERRVRAIDLRVQVREGRPVVVGPDLSAPLSEFLGGFLTVTAANAFRPFPDRPHTPRIYLDELVIQRERWQLNSAAIARLLHDDTRVVDEALLAQKLTEAGIGQRFFFRVPSEPKPVFCDLASAPLVKNLRRLLRVAREAGATAHIEESVPDIEQLWLRRPGGGPRTSEFRLLAVDRSHAQDGARNSK